ncbi:UDP-N-acetylmuramoyl-L-alanyl-D-glutamate--2,6-diaminopimelate ligase [Fundidesulfovibrio terrae]|uniref:UDP-N-acetylmuramoyl-L-alanyl-D-glutamate--2, 6-diaminopimelate ligase n=1 Tax=Fundidesulfovibrio terrae TaxID=2922866 RepID=UPI001FAEF781|nr:UDP-N-acetylmuramoyl-L-alanyl-D-glutamate--2,6-diaminopimelate ligase [Fundidesulfovibrio terrae]
MHSGVSANNLQTLTELLARVAGGLEIYTDSRQVEPGGVFVAVPGHAQDGREFIPMALARGATYVVAAPGVVLPEGSSAVLVSHPDPRCALGELAKARFGTANLPFKLAGVTGTNGKTTVAYLVEHIVRENGGVPGVLGTVEYRWPGHAEVANLTTPGCLKLHSMLAAMAASGVNGAVMEASSHALDQDRLAGIGFDAAVLTNVTQDHLDYHGGMDDYFASKRRLFEVYLKDRANAVINFDDTYGRKLLADMPEAIGYGLEGEDAGFRHPGRALTGRIASQDGNGMQLETSFQGRTWTIASPMAGRHNAQNLLAAQGAALCMGFSPEQMAVLATCQGAPGRLERVTNGKGLSVFVDYAHTPDALENVLKALRSLDFDRVIAVFGCGGDRDRTKRPLMARAVAKWADIAVLTSDNPRHEAPEAIMADAMPGLTDAKKVIADPDRRKAIGLALHEMGPRDVLLIAGKGHETYQQIGDVKHPFNDVTVVKELLS